MSLFREDFKDHKVSVSLQIYRFTQDSKVNLLQKTLKWVFVERAVTRVSVDKTLKCACYGIDDWDAWHLLTRGIPNRVRLMSLQSERATLTDKSPKSARYSIESIVDWLPLYPQRVSASRLVYILQLYCPFILYTHFKCRAADLSWRLQCSRLRPTRA